MTTKKDKLKKLKEKKIDLEHRLFEEQVRQHERINKMGWGYGMRHAKLNFSTSKEDRLIERIDKIEKQIKEIENEVRYREDETTGKVVQESERD